MHRILLLLIAVGVAHAENVTGAPADPQQPGQTGDDATRSAEQTGDPGAMNLVMLLVFGFLILMIVSSVRGQKKEQRKRQEMITNLKVGDRVVTIGGVRGTVVRRGEQEIDVRTGGDGKEGVVLTFTPAAVNQVVGDDEPAPAKE